MPCRNCWATTTRHARATLDVLHRVLAARGDLSDEEKRRLTRVEALFGALPAKAVRAETAHA